MISRFSKRFAAALVFLYPLSASALAPPAPPPPEYIPSLLTLEQARQGADAALKACSGFTQNPVVVEVLDWNGNVRILRAADHAAVNAYRDVTAEGHVLTLTHMDVYNGAMAVRDKDSQPIGAVAVARGPLVETARFRICAEAGVRTIEAARR